METTASATYNNKDGDTMKEAISLNDITLISNTEQVFQDGDALLLVELQQKLNAQNKNVTRLEEENLKLQKSLEEFTKVTKMKKRRLEDDAQQDETNRLKEKIKILELRLDEREEELHELREKVAESEWSDYKNEANKTMNEGKSSSESQDSALLKSLEVILDKKFEDVDKKIASLDTKLAKVEMERISIKDDFTKFFSTAVKQNLDESVLGKVITQAKNTDRIEETERATSTNENNAVNIRDIMRQSKNEEMQEEAEKRRRDCNSAVHGVDANVEPSEFIDNLIKTLSIGALKPKAVKRVGNGEKKPLIVTFRNSDEKSKFMSSLNGLKGKNEYQNLRITDDYTINERNLIRQLSEQAKQKNIEEGSSKDFSWRVRGSSKNGFRIMKIYKKQNL